MPYTIHPVKGQKDEWAIVPSPDIPGNGIVLYGESQVNQLIKALAGWKEGEFGEEIDAVDRRIFDAGYIAYQEANEYSIATYGKAISPTSWSYIAREGTVSGGINKDRQWYVPRSEFLRWIRGRFETMTRDEYNAMKRRAE